MTAPQWPSFGASAARPLPELTASVFLSASSSSIPLLPQRLATASGRRFVLPPCCNHNAARRVTGSGVCSLFHPPPAPPPPLARGRRVVRLFGCPAVMAAKHAHTHRRARSHARALRVLRGPVFWLLRGVAACPSPYRMGNPPPAFVPATFCSVSFSLAGVLFQAATSSCLARGSLSLSPSFSPRILRRAHSTPSVGQRRYSGAPV